MCAKRTTSKETRLTSLSRIFQAGFVATIAGMSCSALAQGDARFCGNYAANASDVAGDGDEKESGLPGPLERCPRQLPKSFRLVHEESAILGSGRRGEHPPFGGAVHRHASKAPAAATPQANATQGDARFCGNYAKNASEVAGTAMRKNPACLDPSRGVHDNYQSHFDWCMKNPPSSVQGAEANIRRLAAQCTGNASNPPQAGAAPKPSSGALNASRAKTISFPGGRYTRLQGDHWAELGDNGGRFNFVQTNINDHQIFLQDRSRGVHITLNLRDRTIYYKGSKDSNFRSLYKITKVE